MECLWGRFCCPLLFAAFTVLTMLASGVRPLCAAERYRVELSIAFDDRAGTHTPVQMDMDFGALLGQAESRLVDPHVLSVTRETDGTSRTYPVSFSETLYTSNSGWIAWSVDQPEKGGRWFLEFGPRALDGSMAEPGYLPAVGVGDQLRHNGHPWRPIGSPGYHANPIPVDWNGDGLIDIISRSHGANHFGMPMAGIFYWRNIGTNQEPRFAPPLRLHAEGVDQQQLINEYNLTFEPRRDFIGEDYIACDVFDWFDSGRLDLITLSAPGGIKVYRNTGRLDAAGLPVLELAMRPEYPSCISAGRYPCLRVIDWDGSGRPALMIGSLWKGDIEGKRQILRQIALMRAVGGADGDWEFESAPLGVAGGPETMPTDWREYSNFEGERAWYFDVHDIDGDGRMELICGRRWDVVPAMEVWRNVGTLEHPVMKFDRELPWYTHYSGFCFRFVQDQAFNGCLIGSVSAGAGMRYFEQVRPDVFALDAFADRGVLLGQACELKLEGYVRPCAIDVDGNGTMDLICGDEPGSLTLVKNVGTPEMPAFAPPSKIQDHHGVELLLSDTNLHPRSRSKSYIGQLKPFVCDWDVDGKLDIIVSGGTFDDVYWLDDYDPATNRIGEMRIVRAKEAHPDRSFTLRTGPAVVDWDEDGRPELLAVDRDDRICWYKQGIEGPPEGLTMLEPGVPLLYEDGEEITKTDFLPYGNITLWPCDWTESGACDLVVASNHFTWLVENAGTNAEPVFRRPVQFQAPDGTPIETSHHENHATAWDWDGDGHLDLLVGAESGAIHVFHRDWLSGITHAVQIVEGSVEPRTGADR